MHGLLKCCYQVSAFARLAVPYKAHAIEGMGRLVAAPVRQKSAYFASRSTDGDQEAYRVMLRPLYRPELQYATSKYMSCFFRPVYEDGEVVDKTEDTELTNKLEQLLQSTGCRQSLQDFTDEVDNVDMAAYENCSIDVLRAELKRLRDAGVHDVMEATFPEGAHLVRHYDKFMDLLEKRSAD